MKLWRASRLGLSLLLLLALVVLLQFLVDTRPGFSYLRFFTFFTNQSNILVALFFGINHFRPWSRPVYDRIRGALILYMTMTTSIYWLFLHRLVHIEATAPFLANCFLHSGALAILLVDWWLNRPQTFIRKRFLTSWMSYPLLYTIVVMIMGRVQDWYPYPFLNVPKIGWEKWILWNGSFALGIALLSVGIILINNRLSDLPSSLKR